MKLVEALLVWWRGLSIHYFHVWMCTWSWRWWWRWWTFFKMLNKTIKYRETWHFLPHQLFLSFICRWKVGLRRIPKILTILSNYSVSCIVSFHWEKQTFIIPHIPNPGRERERQSTFLHVNTHHHDQYHKKLYCNSILCILPDPIGWTRMSSAIIRENYIG